MMNSKSFIAAATAIGLAACSVGASAPAYQVTASLPDAEDGSMAYLINFDNSEKMDSAVVSGASALFKGEIPEPVMAQIIVDGNRYGMFVLEQGAISFENGQATGSPLNKTVNDYSAKVESLSDEMKALGKDAPDSLRDEIYIRYAALNDSTLEANIGNPLGYYLFLQKAYDMSQEELADALDRHPDLKNFVRIKKVMAVFERKAATTPGKMFSDFEVVYDGKTYRLSDYVGKGNYTLVDFWASWCGPCRREAQVIKEIYAEYAPKGLDIVGIAVWDEPENTLQAIDELQLPWKQVINAQTVPTDLYGILGIPCIILFAPDGTIISRDLQGDELKASVAAAMAGATPAVSE